MSQQDFIEFVLPMQPDAAALFNQLFSFGELKTAFHENFASTTAKGADRLNGFQFARWADAQLAVVADKCMRGQYRFTPYLEVLKTKGRDKKPRLIGIPTVRDRIVLHQLNKYLAALYPERVPKSIASTYARTIAGDLRGKPLATTWVCTTDIKTFYDSIRRDRLLRVLSKKVKSDSALKLIAHALATPTVPKNSRRKLHKEFRSEIGVPQGLSISNILAAIYMQEVDDAMSRLGFAYYRYVDDVLMYGEREAVATGYRSLRARLVARGLSLHPLGSGKTHIEPLSKAFGYLGYTFKLPAISVRDSTVERFLQSIAAKFSDYSHNKARRLEKFNYLTPDRLKEIFLSELNERITGAISERRRYGWIAYFNEITDLTLLHRLDHAISGMFGRLADFGNSAPIELKKLSRSYYEMKFNPEGGYVRNYDKITTPAEMLAFLAQRGRVSPNDTLTDDEIQAKYEKYLHHVLSAMHADEGVLY